LKEFELKLGKYDDDANLGVLHVELIRDFTTGQFGESENKRNYGLKLLLIQLLWLTSVLKVACEYYDHRVVTGRFEEIVKQLNYA